MRREDDRCSASLACSHESFISSAYNNPNVLAKRVRHSTHRRKATVALTLPAPELAGGIPCTVARVAASTTFCAYRVCHLQDGRTKTTHMIAPAQGRAKRPPLLDKAYV